MLAAAGAVSLSALEDDDCADADSGESDTSNTSASGFKFKSRFIKGFSPDQRDRWEGVNRM